MNFQYCSSCGAKIEYMLSVPNFCPSCGIHFNQNVDVQRSVAARPPAQSIASKNVSDDPDGTSIEHVPILNKLEYEVDKDYSSIGGRIISMKDLVGHAPTEPIKTPVPKSDTKRKRGRPRKVKPPTMEQKFEAVKGSIDECKSSTDNIVDVEE